MFKRKKVFIFGASGLLGKIIFSQLSKQHVVYGSSHRQTENKKIFKINYKKISKKHLKIINQSNYIINCIGENQNEKKMNDINCLILDRISKNLTNKNIKYFIHISTCGVYGNLEKNLISEKELPHPYTLYSKTKLKGEKILFTNLRTKFPVIILRCSQVVGLQMRNTSIKKLSFYIKKNLFFFINNKKSIYSFIFQDDIIRCLKIIISKKNLKDNIYNLSNFIRYEDLVNKILITLKKKKKIPNIPSIFLLPIIKFFEYFNFKFPLNTNQLNSLMTKKIYLSRKIKKTLHLKSMTNINSKNLKYLIND